MNNMMLGNMWMLEYQSKPWAENHLSIAIQRCSVPHGHDLSAKCLFVTMGEADVVEMSGPRRSGPASCQAVPIEARN